MVYRGTILVFYKDISVADVKISDLYEEEDLTILEQELSKGHQYLNAIA
jgi:hypothetical protein